MNGFNDEDMANRYDLGFEDGKLSAEKEIEQLRAENERLSDIESDVLSAASDLGLYDGDDVQSAIDLLRNEVDYHHKWMWQAEGLLCIGSARPDDVMAKLTRLKAENARLRAALERDRTRICDAVNVLKDALKGRFWLTEGRGSYRWDDHRYRYEFQLAYQAAMKGVTALEAIAADLTDCPTDRAAIDAARKGEHDA